VSDRYDVFLSCSRNGAEVATFLLGQLKQAGLEVFRDQESIWTGETWLNRLQEAVEACGAFVVLIGRDGVRRSRQPGQPQPADLVEQPGVLCLVSGAA
jgi:hypothetical protein